MGNEMILSSAQETAELETAEEADAMRAYEEYMGIRVRPKVFVRYEDADGYYWNQLQTASRVAIDKVLSAGNMLVDDRFRRVFRLYMNWGRCIATKLEATEKSRFFAEFCLPLPETILPLQCEKILPRQETEGSVKRRLAKGYLYYKLGLLARELCPVVEGKCREEDECYNKAIILGDETIIGKDPTPDRLFLWLLFHLSPDLQSQKTYEDMLGEMLRKQVADSQGKAKGDDAGQKQFEVLLEKAGDYYYQLAQLKDDAGVYYKRCIELGYCEVVEDKTFWTTDYEASFMIWYNKWKELLGAQEAKNKCLKSLWVSNLRSFRDSQQQYLNSIRDDEIKAELVKDVADYAERDVVKYVAKHTDACSEVEVDAVGPWLNWLRKKVDKDAVQNELLERPKILNHWFAKSQPSERALSEALGTLLLNEKSGQKVCEAAVAVAEGSSREFADQWLAEHIQDKKVQSAVSGSSVIIERWVKDQNRQDSLKALLQGKYASSVFQIVEGLVVKDLTRESDADKWLINHVGTPREQRKYVEYVVSQDKMSESCEKCIAKWFKLAQEEPRQEDERTKLVALGTLFLAIENKYGDSCWKSWQVNDTNQKRKYDVCVCWAKGKGGDMTSYLVSFRDLDRDNSVDFRNQHASLVAALQEKVNSEYRDYFTELQRRMRLRKDGKVTQCACPERSLKNLLRYFERGETLAAKYVNDPCYDFILDLKAASCIKDEKDSHLLENLWQRMDKRLEEKKTTNLLLAYAWIVLHLFGRRDQRNADSQVPSAESLLWALIQETSPRECPVPHLLWARYNRQFKDKDDLHKAMDLFFEMLSEENDWASWVNESLENNDNGETCPFPMQLFKMVVEKLGRKTAVAQGQGGQARPSCHGTSSSRMRISSSGY